MTATSVLKSVAKEGQKSTFVRHHLYDWQWFNCGSPGPVKNEEDEADEGEEADPYLDVYDFMKAVMAEKKIRFQFDKYGLIVIFILTAYNF